MSLDADWYDDLKDKYRALEAENADLSSKLEAAVMILNDLRLSPVEARDRAEKALRPDHVGSRLSPTPEPANAEAGVLDAFVHPRATRREPGSGPPEADIMWIEVTMADWFRLHVLAGDMDANYLRILPEHARPSLEFIEEIEAGEASQ